MQNMYPLCLGSNLSRLILDQFYFAFTLIVLGGVLLLNILEAFSSVHLLDLLIFIRSFF